MPQLGTGTPGVFTDVQDKSSLGGARVKGVCGVFGITERGDLGKAVLVKSWPEYERNFGGLLAYSDFPFYCKLMLERGAPLLVARAAHYTDVTDISTVIGNKSDLSIIFNPGSPTGGILFEAANIGEWGDGLSVSLSVNVAVADYLDVNVTLAGYPALAYSLRIPVVPTLTDIAQFNDESKLVKIFSAFGTLEENEATAFENGYSEYSGFVLADITGDTEAKTGLRSFDDSTEAVRYCIPEYWLPVLNEALVNYCLERGDCRPVLRAPTGITGREAIDIRSGTGAYAGMAVFDAWEAEFVMGGIKLKDPITGVRRYFSSIAAYVGAKGYRDNKAKPWLSVAELQFSKVACLGLDYNLGGVARVDEADAVNKNGINTVIDDGTGPVLFGDWSMQQQQNTKLRDGNVADLTIYILRTAKATLKLHLSKPNEPGTWKAMRNDLETMMGEIVTGAGVYENGYRILDDSAAETIDDVQVNTVEDIDMGIYRIHLYIKPIGSMKYIGLTLILNNSSFSYELLGEAA